MLSLGVTFWFISLSGAMSPGPLSALALTEGARAGRWSGPKLALGHGVIELALVIAAVYGLGEWLRAPLVSGLIGVVGGAFLLWMGTSLALGAWRGQLTLAAAADAPPPLALRLGAPAAGIAVTVANPYWTLWWLTVGLTYIMQASWLGLAGVVAFYLLGHWAVDLLWLTFLSWLAASGHGRIPPQVYRGLLLACGLFLAGMSLVFAYSGWQFLRQAGR